MEDRYTVEDRENVFGVNAVRFYRLNIAEQQQ